MAIDRKELVLRHNPVLRKPDPRTPLSVGNGEFTFTADITGLQTFMDDYRIVPLCTMSQWGWHSFPVSLDESRLKQTCFDTFGRKVGYAYDPAGQHKLFNDLRQNPHRLNLASIGLNMEKEGQRARLADIQCPEQVLDMWSGLLRSRFTLSGKEVTVETCVSPDQDAVSALVSSPWVGYGVVSVRISFPYGSPEKHASDWDHPERHSSEIIRRQAGRATIRRVLDDTVYYADLVFQENCTLRQEDPHTFVITAGDNAEQIAFACRFTSEDLSFAPPDHGAIKKRAAEYWERFWSDGGAIELANSRDPRAIELERRIVLSQYLTAIQCSGSTPPAETGLTFNSWYGKFHLEMHFWHAAHFPVWGRRQMLEKSLEWYHEILPVARRKAESQGYSGVRWPKMCDSSGRDSPSPIGVLLVWQQPHPIMLAELCYRACPSGATLMKYRDLVVESALFMADFAHYDSKKGRYVLGPPLIPVQETHDPTGTLNPAFELEYFRWGLKTASQWLKRLGEQPVELFDQVAENLSRLPVGGDVYLAHENCPDTFRKAPFNQDHPSMVGALGVLPGEGVDPLVMKRTVERVLECWDMDSMWGWDFPMMAMCCARLGMTSKAIDILMMDAGKNTYLPNGHNAQAGREDLPIYLPGNGALLLATGMMAAGWDGGQGTRAPGFPADGSWNVEYEGILPYI
ncbi:MAG TPA: glycoside hydrolase family 65 [Thermoclostridium sp.]|nr:glycoside hydrolase family 65 [Clostridiaceae bacterium]HOQ75703.1 glycoside hydrolase family 65 [Thermoclostridium sp.]HPU45316.1 glycoside hydrolase family 65 [Thermoclostridium sp.]